MLTKEAILAALASVPGPDGKTPLPDSGAIDGLTMREGKVFLAIKVDPRKAQMLERMRAAAEGAIKAMPDVTGAVVTLTAENENRTMLLAPVGMKTILTVIINLKRRSRYGNC